MSTQGKIKTLFSDKEKTEALFPRTKINAVSDENGKGLNAILDDMAYVGDITEDVVSTPVNADLLGGRPAREYATQNYVANEIAKAQLEGEDVDLSGYATKDEMNAAIRAIDFPVDSVNGRTGTITLSASDVGARPDTWLPTIAEIGAAPAGIVSKTIRIASETELDNALTEEINTMANDSTRFLVFAPTTSAVFGGIAVLCRLYKRSSSGYGTADFIGYATYGPNTWQKSWYGGTWQPLEWDNPPMIPGVEYRTTERHNGKVVYTMLIDIGALPNAATKVVENLMPYGVNAISITGYATRGTGMIPLPHVNVTVTFNNEWSYPVIYSPDDMSGFHGYLTVRYTKN